MNPHNPEFLTKVPWYSDNKGSTNFPSNAQSKRDKEKPTSSRGGKQPNQCRNCGSVSHPTRDCLNKPLRKVAKPTSSHKIKASGIRTTDVSRYNNNNDDSIDDISNHDYSSKRDGWKGYEAEDYIEQIRKFDRIQNDSQRNCHDKNRLDKSKTLDQMDNLIAGDDEQWDFQGRKARQGGVGGNQMAMTARNLRIREDVPKYLSNLDLNGAYFDPKARSMRMEESDNIMNGDILRIDTSSELIAAIANNPSQVELVNKDVSLKKSANSILKWNEMKNKYEDHEDLKKNGNIYDSSGSVKNMNFLTGEDEVTKVSNNHAHFIVPSKFIEDVFETNHSSVFGSYFCRQTHKWGYSCCGSKKRYSICSQARNSVETE